MHFERNYLFPASNCVFFDKNLVATGAVGLDASRGQADTVFMRFNFLDRCDFHKKILDLNLYFNNTKFVITIKLYTDIV